MNKFTRSFSMDKERWSEVRTQGFWRYALYKGVLQMGLIGGCMVLAVKYFADSGYSLGSMSVREFILGYLAWLPFALIAGFLAAGFIWLSFEEKFRE